MSNVTQFDKEAAAVKKSLLISADPKSVANLSDEEAAKKGIMNAEAIRSGIMLNFKEANLQMGALRKGGANVRSLDLTLEQFVKSKFGFGTLDSFYEAIGVDASMHTVENLMSMPEFNEGYRWLVPEIFREAIRLGLRRNPIYPNLIAAEETVTQTVVTLPMINMSAAMPSKLNETETIPTGSVSFNQKIVKLQKIGTGLKISDEVIKYVPLNILSIYLQDVGVQLGLGMDSMAIDVLLNGDGSAGSAAPVIGVESTTNGITYFDLLRAWVRMGRLGRMPSALLSNELAGLKIFQMDEFKGANYNNKKQDLNIKTPIPQTQDYYIHGGMPSDGTLLFLDRTAALMKLNATGLLVESERIAERQMQGTYVTQTTGFGKLFNDAAVAMDPDLAFASNGFPAGMDIDKAERVTIGS